MGDPRAQTTGKQEEGLFFLFPETGSYLGGSRELQGCGSQGNGMELFLF